MSRIQSHVGAFLKRLSVILRNGQQITDNKSRTTNHGQLAWRTFLLALLTGIILSFHYRPWGDVFGTVSKISGHLPYGAFLRKCHWLSGQAFLVFTIAHTSEHFLKKSYLRIRPREWLLLVILLFPSFFLVFTGFVLKGDKEGMAAGRIMYRLAQEIPHIGSDLARMLLRPGEEFFLLPYIHHTVILPLSLIFLLNRHRRCLFPKRYPGWPLIALLAFLALVCPLPRDVPPHAEVSDISGPWFFHGIQLILGHISAFWAGVAWPLAPFVALAILPFVPSRFTRWMAGTAAAIWLLHLAILVVAWCV